MTGGAVRRYPSRYRRPVITALAVAMTAGVGLSLAVAQAGAAAAPAPAATTTTVTKTTTATTTTAPAPTVVRVAGGPARLPRGTRVLGALRGAARLSLDVVLRPADPAALVAFDQAVTTPGSPAFRHFVTPDQFAARFGPSSAAIAATRSWLSGQGLSVGATARDGLLIAVSGSAPQLADAFGVGFEQVRLPDGRLARVPTGAPAVPRTLSGVVQGVVGLDDVSGPTAQLVRGTARSGAGPAADTGGDAAPVSHTSGPVACADAESTPFAHTATELAQAYSFSSVYATDEGQGVTVGIYELEPFLHSDIAAFESCYGISTTVNPPVAVDGGAGTGAGSGEAALDIEMVAGMAPQATIDVYEGPNLGDGPLDVYAAMVDQDAAQVLSTSWGQCEPAAGTAVVEAEASLFAQAAAQGQTVVAAAGDEGSEDCDVPGFLNATDLEVDDPASQPWVTGVGGTELDSLGPPPSETTWNTGTGEGTGGGGVSTLWTMPSWQLGPGVESAYTEADDSFTGASPCPLGSGAGTVSCREVPDVSADADPNTGYAVYWTAPPVQGESPPSPWRDFGGTSMGSPLWAAVVALADEQASSKRMGLIDPALYQAGCLATPPFNDVTTGDNQPNDSAPGDPPHAPGGPYYPATAGYDMATGLGTPDVSALVPDLLTPVDACPQVTGMSVAAGPDGGGTVVTLTGANLQAVTEVDFGPSNAGSALSVSGSSVTVTTPPSPTGGWDTAEVVVRTPDDAVGFDGRDYFTYTGPRGYWTTASDGGVFTFGHVGYYRSLGGIRLNRPVVGIAPTPSSRGYWLVASDGGVFTFGNAGFYGSTGDIHLDDPVVGMAPTPDGHGYWLVASDGGVFAYGDAGFFGSLGGIRLDAPVVGMASTPDGGGYWLVASDGGVFAFGDARFYGSTGGIRLQRPVVGMVATPDGAGYVLAASDGGVFTYGDAGFYGSLGGIALDKPVVGITAPFGGHGYWLVASDGGIFAFGPSAGYFGSMGGRPLDAPMVGVGGT